LWENLLWGLRLNNRTWSWCQIFAPWHDICRNLPYRSLRGFLSPEIGKLDQLRRMYVEHNSPLISSMSIYVRPICVLSFLSFFHIHLLLRTELQSPTLQIFLVHCKVLCVFQDWSWLQHCRALFTTLWAFLYVVFSTRVAPQLILLASFMTLLMICQSANFLSSGTGLQTHIFGWIQWASSQCPLWSYPNWAWQLYFTEGTVSSNSTQIFLYPSIMCTFRNDSKHMWILKQAIVKVSAWSKRERSPA
jgi:hypothetical protein